MARVVVVGGGLGGAASAARLAKLGHPVTLLERGEQVGGALTDVRRDGFAWDGGPSHTLVPAVLRDLFRKSGRPLEAELGELEPLPVLRRHRFPDGSELPLPGGSRAAQRRAWDALEPGLGARWTAYVESSADDWEVVRRGYAEVPWDRADRRSPEARALLARLDSRATLRRRLRGAFRDRRQRLVAAYPFAVDGHHPRDVPGWCGLVSYLEQRFGGWQVPGGTGRLAEALAARLATRRVTVLSRTTALDVEVRGGRAVAVLTDAGPVDADLVVCAVDPRRLPALAPYVERTMPAIPPVVCHVGLRGDVPDPLASPSGSDPAGPSGPRGELVLHGGSDTDPLLVLRTNGRAPEGHAAWTVLGRGRVAEDLLLALARHGIDVRDAVTTRVDLSPRQLVERWGGSPLGVAWQGRGTVRDRLGPTTPVPGVFAAGAHATPGSGIPFVGLSSAQVAQAIGPAER